MKPYQSSLNFASEESERQDLARIDTYQLINEIMSTHSSVSVVFNVMAKQLRAFKLRFIWVLLVLELLACVKPINAELDSWLHHYQSTTRTMSNRQLIDGDESRWTPIGGDLLHSRPKQTLDSTSLAPGRRDVGDSLVVERSSDISRKFGLIKQESASNMEENVHHQADIHFHHVNHHLYSDSILPERAQAGGHLDKQRLRRASNSIPSYNFGTNSGSEPARQQSQQQFRLAQANNQRLGQPPRTRTRLALGERQLQQQPPSELMFSNQTGAVALCGVARELELGILKADRQQQKLHNNQGQEPGASGARLGSFYHQQANLKEPIQIRWEKENGDEIEQFLYASDPMHQQQQSAQSSGQQQQRPLRYVRQTDGALVFEPFNPADYRPDVHSESYRCVATSQARGASLVSRNMRVQAIVSSPPSGIQVEVLDELVIEGNGAQFKCQVPAYAAAYLQPLDWIEYPSETTLTVQSTTLASLSSLFPSQTGSGAASNAAAGQQLQQDNQQLKASTATANYKPNQASAAHNTSNAATMQFASDNLEARPSYFVNPKTGDLHILNVDSSLNYRTYKCRCKNKLTGEIVGSTNRGKLIVSESNEPLAPKFAYSFAASNMQTQASSSTQTSGYYPNLAARAATTSQSSQMFMMMMHPLMQQSQSSAQGAGAIQPSASGQLASSQQASSLIYDQGDLAMLVCPLQAFPRAQLSWFKRMDDLELAHIAASGGPDAQARTGKSNLDQDQQLAVRNNQRFRQLGNLLFIRLVGRNDSGNYVCQAKNSVGEEKAQMSLLVRGQLNAKLSTSANVLELGKSLALECSVSGFPIQQVVFKHNQRVIKSISGTNQQQDLSPHSFQQNDHQIHSNQATGSARLLTSGDNYFILDNLNAADSFNGDEDAAAAASNPSSSGLSSSGQVKQLEPSGASTGVQLEPDVSKLLSHVMVIVLEPQHAGAYQCFAQNQFETVQSSAYIRVLDDPPKFRDTFKSEVFAERQDISLLCSARANPLPEITWSIDEQALPESARVRFGDFVTKDNLVISYVNISSIQVIDSGLYRCTADNGLARVSHEAQVSVQGPVQVKPMANVTVLAATSFRHRCPVAGYPIGDIQWHHNGHRLPANHRQHVYENGTLEVEHMDRAAGDEGEYICTVGQLRGSSLVASTSTSSPTNGLNEAQASGSVSGQQQAASATSPAAAYGSLQVSIRVRPTIEPFAISRQLREGQRASIMCTISSGDLPISISWFRNDQLLVPVNRAQVDTNNDNGPHQASTMGSSAPQVAAIVQPGAPDHLDAHLAANLAQLLANGAAGGASSAPGEPNGAASGPGAELLPGVIISRVSDYSSTLLFESLLAQHSANYTCLARNEAGSVSHQAPMVVQVAPKWSIEPNDSNIVRGSSASIDCAASGFPPPRIIWTKAASGDPGAAPGGLSGAQQQPQTIASSSGQNGGQQQQLGASAKSDLASGKPASHHLGAWRSIVSSPHLQVFENGSLNILDARDSDVGHYMCQASNGVGTGLSKVIRIVVNVAAQFLTRHSIQYVARGEQSQLKCQARGDWPISLYWFRNKHRLEQVNLQEAPLAPAISLNGKGQPVSSSSLNAAGGISPATTGVALSNTISSLILVTPAGQQQQHQQLATNHNLNHSSASSGGQISLADQLNALIASTGSQAAGATAGSTSTKSNGGQLLQRYSLASSELLLTPSGHSRQPNAGSTGLDWPPEATSRLRDELLAARSSGGQQQAQQSQLQPLVIQFNSVLTIQQAERQDTAIFRCLAANQFGQDERTIQLIVQEPPDKIEDLSVLEVSSRSVTLGWLAPFDGNAPITHYHVQYRAINPGSTPSSTMIVQQQHFSSDSINNSNWLNHTLATGTHADGVHNANEMLMNQVQTSHESVNLLRHLSLESGKLNGQGPNNGRSLVKIVINSLRPVTRYWFRIEAENKLGRGPNSGIIESITMEEAPGAAPNKLKAVAQSSSSILVSWSRLSEKDIFGRVDGYYVGYRRLLGPSDDTTLASSVNYSADNNNSSSSRPTSMIGENNTPDLQQQQQTSASTTVYKTIRHDDKLNKFDALLTGLKRQSKYMISVQAFNARGTGPSSEPVIVKTLEMDPPKQVKLFVRQANNCSIQVEWRPLSQAALSNQQQAQTRSSSSKSISGGASGETNSRPGSNQTIEADVVDYYSLYQAELNDRPRWQEIRLPGHASSHQIDQLKCGTRYQFYMTGVNRIGVGDQSDILDTKTTGGLPVAPPDKQSVFDVINTTCFIIRLDHWQDNGCPIRRFDVRYRSEQAHDWIPLANFDLMNEQPDSKSFQKSNGLDNDDSANSTATGGSVGPEAISNKLTLDGLSSIGSGWRTKRSISSQDNDIIMPEDQDDDAFLDYSAASLDDESYSGENGAADLADYLALEAASTISKDANAQADVGDRYSDTGGRLDDNQLDAQRQDGGDSRPMFVDLKDSPMLNVAPPDYVQSKLVVEPVRSQQQDRVKEWQASNFIENPGKNVDNPGQTNAAPQLPRSSPAARLMAFRQSSHHGPSSKSAGHDDVDHDVIGTDKTANDWRQIRLCNLVENSHYSVQVVAENSVGPSQVEVRLLTSSDGIEYDHDSKRLVVINDRLSPDGKQFLGNRMIHSAMSLNDRLNQWPMLVPISLTLSLVTLIIIITFLLKRSTNSPPGSMSTTTTSSSGTGTTITTTSGSNGPQTPPQSNRDCANGFLNDHYHAHHHNHHPNQSRAMNHYHLPMGTFKLGAPSTTTNGAETFDGSDPMSTTDNYATIAGPISAAAPRGSAAYFGHHRNLDSMNDNSNAGDDDGLGLPDASDLSLSNIYHQQNYRTIRSLYGQQMARDVPDTSNNINTKEPTYNVVKFANAAGLIGHQHLDSCGNTATNSTNETGTNLASCSPPTTITTGPMSTNSCQSGPSMQQFLQQQPALDHMQQVEVSKRQNVYLCTKNESKQQICYRMTTESQQAPNYAGGQYQVQMINRNDLNDENLNVSSLQAEQQAYNQTIADAIRQLQPGKDSNSALTTQNVASDIQDTNKQRLDGNCFLNIVEEVARANDSAANNTRLLKQAVDQQIFDQQQQACNQQHCQFSYRTLQPNGLNQITVHGLGYPEIQQQLQNQQQQQNEPASVETNRQLVNDGQMSTNRLMFDSVYATIRRTFPNNC